MARGDDIYDLAGKLQDERQRLQDAVKEGVVTEADQDAIIRFDQYRDVEQGMKNSTRYSDGKHLRVAAIRIDVHGDS